ncbi:MAG: hypothetical protein ACLFQY_07175 [Desulfococcaceae bacterium]
MAYDKMALKPYLEAIEALCNESSKEELTEVILAFAKEVPVGDRAGFLFRLRTFFPSEKNKPDAGKWKISKNSIFDRIEALKEDMEERAESIEDGSFWDSGYNYDDDEYCDDEPDFASEEQIDELIDLFAAVEDFFLNNDSTIARDVYRRLFDLLDQFDDLHYLMSGNQNGFDLKEAKARYCRCVYETSDKDNRVREMIEAMDVGASIALHTLILDKESFPMLQDVIDAKPEDLADWEEFLSDWAGALKEETSNRAAILRLEASSLLEGADGPAKLAREWGKTQPRGYVFWIQDLAKREDWKGLSEACQEALKTLHSGPFREQAAGYLVKAAENLSDPDLILKGKREQFFSVPEELNLLALIEEAERQELRETELENIHKVYANPKKGTPLMEGPLYTKFLLMAGEVKAAFQDAQKEDSVGWSSGKAGLVFGSTLYIVCGKSDSATTIQDLLKSYASRKVGFYSNTESIGKTSFYSEILKGLHRAEVSSADTRDFQDWADKIGRGRIDHIVSNKYRNAYSRAASTLGALAECLILSDRMGEAQRLVKEFYSEKYNRFPAFRREVKAVFQQSELLRVIRL